MLGLWQLMHSLSSSPREEHLRCGIADVLRLRGLRGLHLRLCGLPPLVHGGAQGPVPSRVSRRRRNVLVCTDGFVCTCFVCEPSFGCCNGRLNTRECVITKLLSKAFHSIQGNQKCEIRSWSKPKLSNVFHNLWRRDFWFETSRISSDCLVLMNPETWKLWIRLNLLDALTKLNDWSMDRSDNMYPMFMCIKQLCCLTKPTDDFAMRLKAETQHLRNLHILREISWNISWCKDVDARSMPRQNHDATFFFKLQRHVFTHLSINVCAICCFCCFVPCGKACYLSLHDSFCEDLGHFCGLRELLQLLICMRIGSTGSTALTTNTRLQPVNGHQHAQSMQLKLAATTVTRICAVCAVCLVFFLKRLSCHTVSQQSSTEGVFVARLPSPLDFLLSRISYHNVQC